MNQSEIQSLREEVKERALSGGDMRDHMETLFDLVLERQPRTIVELGVRGGVSTYSIARGAQVVNAFMLCVDRNDCSGALSHPAGFLQMDSVEAASKWRAHLPDHLQDATLDFLMVDTDHTYQHTKAEVEAWLPHMSDRCTLVFHDTNASQLGYGVASYLRDWLKIVFPEEIRFSAWSSPWNIDHYPKSYGLTVLRRA